MGSTCKSETDDEWNIRINQKIKNLRKKEAKIVLDLTTYGKNARLHVNQTRMSFPMGTAIKAKFVAECADEGVNDDYCNFVKDNYNYVVVENDMKWREWEPKRYEFRMENPDKAIKWCLSNGLRARGHNLFWAVGEDYQIPDWVMPLTGDDMREAIDHRIDTAVRHYEGLVEHWDVNNEMLHGQFFVDATGDPNIRVQMFQKVHEISPNTLTFVNDYSILMWEVNGYINQIEDLLNKGAPISGIGIQGHLGPELIDLNKVEDYIDKLWDKFGIPIWITEFDWDNPNSNSDNHAEHATQLENFYRLMLSHEGVEGVLMWGFWDKAHWKPDAAIVNGDDFVVNKAGEAYISLFHETFRTNLVLEPTLEGENLVFGFNGFKGTYDVSIELEDGTMILVMINLFCLIE